MALIPSLVVGEPLEIDWGNAVRDRVVHYAATEAERLTMFPSPTSGLMCWVANIKALTVYDGTSWLGIPHNGYTASTMRIGDITIGKQGQTALQGGYIYFYPAAGKTTGWFLDNYNNYFRLFTGSSEVIVCSPTQIDLVRATVARGHFTAVGNVTSDRVYTNEVHTGYIGNTGQFWQTPGGTADCSFVVGPAVGNVSLESGTSFANYALIYGNHTCYLRSGGAGKQIIMQSGQGGNYNIAHFKESGTGTWRSHVQAAIPVLGGGTAVTIQGLGNDQFGRVSSSRRYKIDVEPISPDDLISAVMRMRPVSYHDNLQTLDKGTQEDRIGMIAEEMAEVDERLVVWSIAEDCNCDTGDLAEDDPKIHDRLSGVHTCWRPEAIDYGRITVPLVGAVQSLSARLAALESKVSALVANLTNPQPEVHPAEPGAEDPEPDEPEEADDTET